MIEEARRRHPDLEFHVGDVEEPDVLDGLGGPFDVTLVAVVLVATAVCLPVLGIDTVRIFASVGPFFVAPVAMGVAVVDRRLDALVASRSGPEAVEAVEDEALGGEHRGAQARVGRAARGRRSSSEAPWSA